MKRKTDMYWIYINRERIVLMQYLNRLLENLFASLFLMA